MSGVLYIIYIYMCLLDAVEIASEPLRDRRDQVEPAPPRGLDAYIYIYVCLYAYAYAYVYVRGTCTGSVQWGPSGVSGGKLPCASGSPARRRPVYA